MISQRDILLLKFPFSDLGGSKVRPALVISNDQYNARAEDFIAVAITSNLKTRGLSILVTNDDLEKGRLIVQSKIKPDKIFSASKKLVRMNVGKVNENIHQKVLRTIWEVIGGNSIHSFDSIY
ncbi:MAG: type II toxin-antitoxin system PemK/MazF family toxin [Nitrososphaerota archaeon]|nr:type II toxin-antitoxin system PemK/MazF family toxin [Nitrososphaerota archaeon]